jgi:dCMP deaminase
MKMAREVATRGTCARRQVGVVLVDENNYILATGHNGPASGWPHCRDNPGFECPGVGSPSGTNLDACVANHSEISALLRCNDTSRIHTVYTTTSPCISCTKALLCTGALRIVFDEEYPHPEAMRIWTKFPRTSKVRGLNSVHIQGEKTSLVENRTWEHFNRGNSGRAIVVDSSEFKS